MNKEILTAKLPDLVEGRETPESWRSWWDEHEPELFSRYPKFSKAVAKVLDPSDDGWMSFRKIDRLEEIDLAAVTYAEMRWQYGTGVGSTTGKEHIRGHTGTDRPCLHRHDQLSSLWVLEYLYSIGDRGYLLAGLPSDLQIDHSPL